MTPPRSRFQLAGVVQGRRILLLILFFLVVLGSGFLIVRTSPETKSRQRPVWFWLGQTAAADHRVREEAELALDAMGVQALPDLVRALRIRESRTLVQVASYLNSLLPSLKWDPGSARILRRQAATAIARLGPKAAVAAAPLTDLLSTSDPDLLREVELALRRLGLQAVPVLVWATRDPNPTVRARAVGLLGNGGDLKPSTEPILDALFPVMSDSEELVRLHVVASISEYTNNPGRALPQLSKALEDPAPKVRAAGAKAVSRFGSRAVSVLPSVRERMKDESAEVRLAAAMAAWSIARTTVDTVPILIRTLEDPDLRWRAALALGDMGEMADEAIPALLHSLEIEPAHRPSRTPASSAMALSRMGPKAVPGLVRLLSHAEAKVRIGAAFALEGHRAGASSAVPALRGLLKERDADMQIVACRVLEAIGPAAADAAPDLVLLCQDREEYVRAAARRALGVCAGATVPVGIPSPLEK